MFIAMVLFVPTLKCPICFKSFSKKLFSSEQILKEGAPVVTGAPKEKVRK